MINGKKVAVVMPAYNAEKTLEQTVRELSDVVDIKILVDDSSKDQTAALSRKLGVQTFVHDANYGYGRNQQTCYREALAAGADIVVMVHPEYHTGFRAFSRELLETLPLLENSDDFVFDNQMIAQAVMFGFRIGEISCPTKYFEEASSINFKRSVKYGFGVLATTASFVAHKLGMIHIPRFNANGRKITQQYYSEV